MIDNRTENKNYPLPNPQNIASQDVGRIADAISMIDADLGSANNSINNIYDAVENLNEKSLKIPEALVGSFETELKNVAPRKYVVVNDEGNGFSTVEGGGGDGGKKGEVLIKNSDENFDTTWIDPRAILRKTATTKEAISDIQLPNNGSIILKDSLEIDFPEDLPQRGLSPIQISGDATADSFVGYILKDEIEATEEDNDFASKTKFGRVKIGSGIDVENGVISVPKIGIASKENFGIVKIGEGFDIDNGVLSTQTYPHADHENYGIIKPSSDFSFASDGSLQLANKSEEIIYQAASKNIVYDGIIKIVPNCAIYRSFINNDTLFSFEFGDFKPKFDIAFDLEIISDGQYVVNFGSDVLWELPCAGVNFGITIIHFKKLVGETKWRGSLKSIETKTIKLLTADGSSDITEDYICGHNGSNWSACSYFAVKGSQDWGGFSDPTGGIWYIDFMRSTYVEYLECLGGNVDQPFEYFYIEGSVDGKNWKRLLSRENEKPTTYTLDAHGFFRHYRILCRVARISYLRWYGFDIDDNLFTLKRVVPRMTADSLNGYNLTCSGKNEGQIYHLTANDSNWVNLKDRLNGEFWIKYELPEAAIVNMIDLGVPVGSESDRFPLWFKIEASNDDENWTILLERAELTRWYQLETRQYYIDNEIPYKFYKFTPIELNGTEFRIARFCLYNKTNGLDKFEWFIPTLSSASQNGYNVTFSTELNNHFAYYAFDGNDSTQWATTSGNAQNSWIQIQFPTETICNAVFLKARSDNSYPQAPTNFEIQASNDGSYYSTLKTVTTTWTQGQSQTIEFFNQTPYLYYRIFIVSVQNAGEYASLSTINFGTATKQYKRDLNAKERLLPIMKSNIQDGYEVSCDSEFNSEWRIWKIFDRDHNSAWSTAYSTPKTTIAITLPEAKICNFVSMYSRNQMEHQAFGTFILYGSNDQQNWNELINVADISAWIFNVEKTWDIENETAYKFYKIEATPINGEDCVSMSTVDLIHKYSVKEY